MLSLFYLLLRCEHSMWKSRGKHLLSLRSKQAIWEARVNRPRSKTIRVHKRTFQFRHKGSTNKQENFSIANSAKKKV